MKLKDANMSGPLRADRAMVLTEAPNIAFEALATAGSTDSHVYSGFSRHLPMHLVQRALMEVESKSHSSQFGSSHLNRMILT